MRKLIAVVFPTLCFSAAHAAEDVEKDFVEDTHLTLDLRNFYAEQRTLEGSSLSIAKGTGKELTSRRTTWVQGAMLNLVTGWTPGLVAAGFDASFFGATLLERGKGRVAGGGDRVPVQNDGTPVDDWGHLGVADARVRVKGTELKAGRFSLNTPVLWPKDNRAIPPTFQGVHLKSTDIPGMNAQVAWFDRVLGRTSSNADRFVSTYGNPKYHGDSLFIAGVDTLPWHSVTGSLYFNRYENAWDRYHAGLTSVGKFGAWGSQTKLAYYSTHDQGSRQLGYIDNSSASISQTLTFGPHLISAGYQQVFGNEFFDYPQETVGNYNPVQYYSDFNGPNEKAAMIRYGLDMAPFGAPGLGFTTWYAKGWDIDGTHYEGDRNGAHLGYGVRSLDGASHWEVGMGVKYVVQSGALKNVTLRPAWYHHRARGGQVDGNYDEWRLVTTVPIKLF